MGQLDAVAAQIVARLRAAFDDGDVESARLLLHPYLHWTDGSGRSIRGRVNVLAHLTTNQPTASPTMIELRDGQIYRWIA